MKELTIEEKAKAYDEALERAKAINNEKDVDIESGTTICEYIFPELKESEDEKIRKEIISILRNTYWTSNKNRFNELVAWLEKQRDKDKLIQELGEYKVKYTQEVLEKYVNSMSNKDDERLRKTAIAFLKDFAEQGYENAVECIDWLKKQGEQASIQTNERAWLYLVSDVLTWKDGIGQYLDDPRVQELAKRLCSEYTQKLYSSSDTLKDEQKSTDKIESRFKVGDWVINKFGDSWHIDSLDKKNYQVSDGKGNYNYFPISKQDEMHLWTIQDAKDGDMLSFYTEYRGNKMFQVGIIEKYVGKHGGCSNTFKIYVGVNWDNNLQIGKYMGCSNIHPATKEQRDLLFQKIKEAGYKWNTETKTLEKLAEPKFKVGDKIVNLPMKYMGGSWTQGIISEITEDKYIFTDSSYIYISSQDSWELVHDKKLKFDPKTLKPFDRVIVRDSKNLAWNINMFSYIDYPYRCLSSFYRYCIPYNNDTKHLIGTKDEAPEYYRYWED